MPAFMRALSFSSLALAIGAFLLCLTALSTLSGFALERALSKRRIFAVPLFEGQYRFELLGNAVFLTVISLSLALGLKLELARFGATGPLAATVTFFAMVLGFQGYYWFLHRAMHTSTLLPMHRWHHRSQVTTPLTGQSMSVFEAMGWAVAFVGLPWLFGLIAPVSFWGWAGYIVFNTFGNIVGHSNVEPTMSATATRFATYFANAFVYHSLHHARWTGHYSFQSALMDRLMGTEWSDWHALFERIIAGHPLQSLSERGDEPQSDS
jgi:sterol desaturase/sphingolipid hydroxylase (fatty acid hydroxylase superfamily)